MSEKNRIRDKESSYESDKLSQEVITPTENT